MEKRLYVGNLPYSTTEEELRTLFGQAGQVASIAIITDRDTGRSKGFGFVEMATPAEAQKALSMLGIRNKSSMLCMPRSAATCDGCG